MSNPWMKFYPSDWRADPALRMCSVAARGLWMEMLCLMHEATPRGSLLVNGKQVNDRMLANLCGLPVRDCAALVSEQEEAGVFSRDPDGTIFSRRMRRDDERAARDKANGGKGGNPKVKGVNPPPNPPVGQGDKAQKPEARSQSGEGTHARDATATDLRIEIASAILESKGLSIEEPEANGLMHQVQCWLNQGIPKDFIIATSVRVIAKLPKFPDLRYLITAIANEWQRACEQPSSQPHSTAGKTPHATAPRRNGLTAAIDGLVERFEAEASEGGEIRQTPAGLLPDGRRH